MTENKTKITIAIIGLIGILGGAFFTNWDKIFPPDPIPPENGENNHEPAPNGEHDENLQKLEKDLENNDREQIRVREEIERIRPMLETDRDAQQAIESQERWLKNLEMQRNQIEREIQGLSEQLQESHN